MRSGDRSPLSAGTPRHERDPSPSDPGAVAYSGPSPLRRRLQDVADTALAEGITLPMHTTFEVVRANGGDGGDERDRKGRKGMDFIVSVISSEALEAKVRERERARRAEDPREVFQPRKM